MWPVVSRLSSQLWCCSAIFGNLMTINTWTNGFISFIHQRDFKCLGGQLSGLTGIAVGRCVTEDIGGSVDHCGVLGSWICRRFNLWSGGSCHIWWDATARRRRNITKKWNFGLFLLFLCPLFAFVVIKFVDAKCFTSSLARRRANPRRKLSTAKTDFRVAHLTKVDKTSEWDK